MNVVSNIDMLYLPLRKGNSRQFFPKNIAFPRLTHVAAFVAEEHTSIDIISSGYKVVPRDIAERLFFTFVDCDGHILAESVPVTNYDVLLNLKLKLNSCVDWAKSYLSKTGLERLDDTIEQYALPLYLFECNTKDVSYSEMKAKTIEVPAGYTGKMSRFLSEADCLGVSKIAVSTSRGNDLWLDLRDSFGRGYKKLHCNVLWQNSGVGAFLPQNKQAPNWQFDNIVLDIDSSTIINGNSAGYITFYYK